MSNGTFTDFLNALRAFESGVDYDRYLSGQITEAQIRGWVGDANWNAYEAGDLSWRDMQYTSVNSLGFVGYQFGEPLLIDLGYYLDNTGNLWTGRFTGKNGVDSFETLKTDIQEAIILDAFGYNLGVIESGLEAKGTSLDALIGTQRTYVDTNGQSVTVTLTLTGILAAAHLRGAWGTLDLLTKGNASADEYGTSILKYIQQFGGYDTPSYSTLVAAQQTGKTLAMAEELWHDDFDNDGAVANYAGWDGTQADGGSTGGQTGGGGETGGDGAATVTTISWMWGTNTALAFDPDLDVLDFGWFQKDNFSIAEVGGSVVITITGNNQTYRLDGVTLAELSMANIRAKDAGALQKWDAALDGAEPAVPSLSIADLSVQEGNAGTRLMTFTVTLSAAAAGTVTVAYSTVDGTATAGSDYVAASGTLSFAPGETSKTLQVTIKGDMAVEGNETFTVRLANATGATLVDGSATGTLTNDDAAPALPALSVADVAMREGDSGTAELMFVVTLDKAATGPVTVNYATANGTASAGSDYAALTGTLTFAAGETSKMVHVVVNGDATVEANETLTLTLSGATGATIADATAVGQITDDDAQEDPGTGTGKVWLVNSVSGADIAGFNPATDRIDLGNANIHSFIIIDTPEGFGFRSPWSGETVIVQGVRLSDLSVQNFEYIDNNHLREALSGALAWENGPVLAAHTVYMRSHEVGQVDRVAFNPATDAVSFKFYGSRENLSMTDSSEGVVIADLSTGQKLILLGVSRANLSAANFEFTFTQVREDDLAGKLGIGQASNGQIVVFNLPIAGGGTVAGASGATDGVTGTDDVKLPAISIADLSVVEGNGDHAHFMFAVTLDKAASGPVTVVYSTANGTATAGSDYGAVSGILAFAPGETSKMVHVDINGDLLAESNETFTVNLSNPAGATLADATAIGTVIDDDGAPVLPALSIADLAVAEGNGEHAHFMFTVTLDKAATGPVTVAYATSDLTAIAGSDYVASNGTLTFAAGETSKTVHVDIKGDAVFEGNETFTVMLSNASGATIADASAVGTIVNDDRAPDQGHVGNGKADTFAITWAWGTNKTIDFDTALDTLDFSWMAKDHFSITEMSGSTIIAIEGNNQTYKLTDVSLAELSLANIVAKDAGAIAEWTAVLDAAQAARDYDLMT